MLDEHPDFVPFVPRHAPAVVFEALLHEIDVLPNEVIDPLVIYHRQVVTISLFIDELRSDRFAQLELDCKRTMYRDYIDLLVYADVLGKRAADALAISLNMTGEDGSDHRSDGEPAEASERTPLQSLQDEPKAARPEDSRDRTS